MNLIDSKFEILEQKPRAIAIPDDMEIGPEMVKQELINAAYRQIELAGRTCYKSEDKITEDSAKGFVERMIKSGHGAMLEHGTIYLKVPVNIDVASNYLDAVSTWTKCRLVKDKPNWWAITTNLRVLVENGLLGDLKYICEPTEYHERRICVRFTCDRGVSHEFVRHKLLCVA